MWSSYDISKQRVVWDLHLIPLSLFLSPHSPLICMEFPPWFAKSHVPQSSCRSAAGGSGGQSQCQCPAFPFLAAAGTRSASLVAAHYPLCVGKFGGDQESKSVNSFVRGLNIPNSPPPTLQWPHPPAEAGSPKLTLLALGAVDL